ncbi:DUF6544 family protein [Clostridium rectalis]|uniref:DUF6544 family protein n=1 Tax=Clostridium rectalis TaxID=2040295 RepID=UPI000F62F67A|nr:DUF6544 family protein [Clostridium rectalis]
MDKVIRITIIIVFILFVIISYGKIKMKKEYDKKVLVYLNKSKRSEEILKMEHIKKLPIQVQKYLNYVGAVGKPKVRNINVSISGEMKQGINKPWMQVKANQYNFYKDYTRIFYIQGRVMGMPLIGMDSYIKGKGSMVIKAASLFKVVDEIGEKMNQAALITLLDDILIFSPGALIDDRITWESVSDNVVKCFIEDHNNKVSAYVHFNEEGALINVETNDRYLIDEDGLYKNVKWSTPVKNYKEVNGIKYPTYGEGIWHLKDGDFTYAKFNIENVQYNVRNIVK